jgi:hypothetical protein
MSVARSFLALTAAAWILGAGLLAPCAQAAPRPEQLPLPAGARVGVVNLLDAEVTHFHSARRMQDGYLKTYPVNWSVAAMLGEAVRERLAQLGLVAVPVAPGDALSRAREECFLNANLAKPLSKGCAAPYAQLAANEKLAALIVLGPGLNDSTHAQATRRKELPEYLRGWCVVSGEDASAPTLLNLTELLLIGLTPKGPLIVDREWGGARTQPWSGFAAPADLKAPPAAQLDQLQPLFAALLKEQAGALLEHLEVMR